MVAVVVMMMVVVTGGALTAFNKASRQCEQTDGFCAPELLQVTAIVVVVAVARD